jgi:hypothetical protein
MKKHEVRRVPADWEHPLDDEGKYIPLRDGLSLNGRVRKWDEDAARWNRGDFPWYVSNEFRTMSFGEWYGERPHTDQHMPNWPLAHRTHFMMYNVSTTDGIPESPVCNTHEELCSWLVENEIPIWGNHLGEYSNWIEIVEKNDVEGDHFYDALANLEREFDAFMMYREY